MHPDPRAIIIYLLTLHDLSTFRMLVPSSNLYGDLYLCGSKPH